MNAEDKFNREVAKRIRDARESAGLSQEELGNKIGMSKVGYGHYERGTHLPNIWQLFQLSRILSRPVEWFLGLATDLTDDEGQLLAIYRAAPTAEARATALRLVRSLISPPSDTY